MDLLSLFPSVSGSDQSHLDLCLEPGQSTNLQVHENKAQGVYVKGLSSIFVASIEEVYELMKQGAKNRMVAYTSK